MRALSTLLAAATALALLGVPGRADDPAVRRIDVGGQTRVYIDGSGRSAPSTAPPEPGGWERHGARSRDIDAAAVIWSFFAAHR